MENRVRLDKILQSVGVKVQDIILAPSSYFMNMPLSAVIEISELAVDDEEKDDHQLYDIHLLAKKYRDQAMQNIAYFKSSPVKRACREFFIRKKIDITTEAGKNDLNQLQSICISKRASFLKKELPLKFFVDESLFAKFLKESLEEFKLSNENKILEMAKVG